MRALVTGGSGFLGKHLRQFFDEIGLESIFLGSKMCDLTQQGALEQFNSDQYDFIFHLAAWTQAGDFCLHHPGEQWIINQKINTNVLAWWQGSQAQAKLVIVGTSCSYSPDLEMIESNYMRGEPIDSLYTYAMTKRMLLQGARALSKQYGLKYFCVVPSTLYGVNYHQDGRQMHFIFDLIRKIIRGKEFGESVELWGDGTQRREIIRVDDFVKIMWKLVTTYENDIVNIGAGEEFTIREFAEIICEIVGYDPDLIRYDESRYVGAKSKCLSVDKGRRLLAADYRTTDLSDGLRSTIDWFYRHKAF